MERIGNVFAHFNVEDSWKALFDTLTLFRKIAKNVAKKLGLSYPQSLDHQICGFIENLSLDNNRNS